MKTPKTTAELAQLLNELSHRERVVFPVSEDVKNKIPDAYAIEVYHTILWNSKHQDRNINIKLVDCLGKPLEENKKPIVNKSKYLRLFTNDYLKNIHDILGGDYSSESLAIENKPLAIC